MLELPQKELLRVDEAANYFSVSERTIRLWAEHGHLEAVKIVGSIRITRESALKCRFGIKKDEDSQQDRTTTIIYEDGTSVPEEDIPESLSQDIEKPEPPEDVIPAKRGRPKLKD